MPRVITASQSPQTHNKNAKHLKNIKRDKSMLCAVTPTCASGASLQVVFMTPVQGDLN